MTADRPASGEQLNRGPVTEPRQAATVILVRGGSSTLEVLLVQRTPKARFMGGAWVFPGGGVDATEGDGDDAHRRAAVRELREEAGVSLEDPAALVKFSRWITPAEVKIRYDTHFFIAPSLPAPSRPSTGRNASISAGSRPAQRCAPTARVRSNSSFPRSSTSSSWARLRTATRCSNTLASARWLRCSRASSSRVRWRASCSRASRATRRRRSRCRRVRGPPVGSGVLGRDHVGHRVDEGEVREGLGVVAQVTSAGGLELLGVEPER